MPETTTRPLGTLSESMFATADLDAAVSHWTGQLGFDLTTDQRPEWVMLTDPRTHQRFALMGPAAGVEPCLGIESQDFETSLAHLVRHGGEVHDRSPEGEDGFRWASCTDGVGVPLMVWQDPSE